MAYLIPSDVDERAMRATVILCHGETWCCRRRPHGVGEPAPVRHMQLPQEVVAEGEVA